MLILSTLEDNKMKYSKRIEEFKIKKNWTTHRLSVEAGISSATVINWFTRGSNPKIEALESVCDAFGITLSEFFNENEEVTYLSSEQKEMLNLWDCFSKREKKLLVDLFKEMLKSRKV